MSRVGLAAVIGVVFLGGLGAGTPQMCLLPDAGIFVPSSALRLAAPPRVGDDPLRRAVAPAHLNPTADPTGGGADSADLSDR